MESLKGVTIGQKPTSLFAELTGRKSRVDKTVP